MAAIFSGGAVALGWVKQGLQREIGPSASFLLYTGAAYVAGEAPLMRAIEAACRRAGSRG